MKWVIVAVLVAASFALLLEVLATVAPWVTRRERVYVVGLGMAAWVILGAVTRLGVMS